VVDAALAQGALTPAPARRTGEGRGPFPRLVLQNVMIIDGTGGPARGPMNIVIENNRIASIGGGGGGRGGRGGADAQAEVIDGRGMYVMPGLIDMHVHAGGAPKNADAEYAYKLWLGHGITTVRGVPLGSFEFTKAEQARSARNEIVAPRIVNYQRPGTGQGAPPGATNSPEQARAWVKWAAQQGIDGLKLDAHDPEIMAALIDEAKRNNLGTVAHLSQMGVGRMDARDAARLGLGTVTHFYGLFEALLKDYTVQPWPVDYNYNDEAHRFGQVARLWDKIYPPGSPEWKELIKEFKTLGTTLDPTMTIYSAGRDVMRTRNADWHAKYTLPSMWEFFEPSRDSHGSYWYNWTTFDEIAWRNFYHVWMQFLNDYKNAGGRVTTGSDAGFIYELYGFGLIQELEMLQEAGFHPLEVIRSATLYGAETLALPKGKPIEYGIIRPGLLADLVVVDRNPLENLKVLYGTGAIKLNDSTGQTERVGGVKYTIKDGIVYDAKKLLADVEAMVAKQKATPPRRAQQ
ncbi:MAG TPA: amidohydrolase family protein, partial [Gemmatimonadaceae bacterium]|nr:amidohydrolase family protein [Gemmatimonadaceae bacterium]